MSEESNKKIGFFSDLHIGIHQNSEKWHEVAIEWAKWFTNELRSQNINTLLFGGDFFHYRDEINVKSLHFANDLLDLFNDFKITMIPGNHDAYYKDNSTIHSLSILNNRKNITIIDKPIVKTFFNKKIGFCPWGTPIKKVSECDLLVGHFEIQNFNWNSFKVCDHGVESCDLLLKSKLIFSGHFHKRQKRKYTNGEIIYVGNPFEMDFNDIQDQKGFYILDFSDKNIKYNFIDNNISPIHVKVNLSDLKKLKPIAKEKGWANLAIKIIIDKDIKTNLLDKVIASINFEAPFSLTTDYLNKFSVGDNITLTNELGDLNIKQCIVEYIESLDIDNKEQVTTKTLHLYNQFV
jgi:DNA repair exonuclease SbcCD nuclease subunit